MGAVIPLLLLVGSPGSGGDSGSDSNNDEDSQVSRRVPAWMECYGRGRERSGSRSSRNLRLDRAVHQQRMRLARIDHPTVRIEEQDSDAELMSNSFINQLHTLDKDQIVGMFVSLEAKESRDLD